MECYCIIKLNLVDRGALFISTVPTMAGKPSGAKGCNAEVSRSCRLSGCWAVGEYPPDCHNSVERYHTAVQVYARMRRNEPLCRAVQFFYPRKFSGCAGT